MTEIIERILPEVANRKLADRADIYIEKGFFDLESARRYFGKVKSLGLPITAHVEQLSLFGGTDLALEFTPQSVDHVVYLSDDSIRRLAKSDTVAVLLPASDLYLKMAYPRARTLIDHGARVALSTDFNPGTSPTQDLSLIGVLARLEMKMSLPEVIAAWTFNSACALGKSGERGSLTKGKACDFICLDGHWRDLFYSVGHHPIQRVVRSGEIT
jgi:imidazolonepropionase